MLAKEGGVQGICMDIMGIQMDLIQRGTYRIHRDMIGMFWFVMFETYVGIFRSGMILTLQCGMSKSIRGTPKN